MRLVRVQPMNERAAGYDAFISHAQADAERAVQICEHLEAAGLRCWIAPRDVRASEPYGAEIMAGITASRCFVLVLSRACNLSDYVHRELERAVTYKKPVFSVRIEDVTPAASLELFVSAVQWIDAWSGRWSEHLDQLAGELASVRAPTAPGAGRGAAQGRLSADPADGDAVSTASVLLRSRALAIVAGVVLLAWLAWLALGAADEGSPGGRSKVDEPHGAPVPEVSGGQARGGSDDSAPDKSSVVVPSTEERSTVSGRDPSQVVQDGSPGPSEPSAPEQAAEEAAQMPASTVPWSLVAPGIVSSDTLHWQVQPVQGSHVDAERAVLELNRGLAPGDPRWRLPTLGELELLAALIDAGALAHATGDLLWSGQTSSVTGQALEYRSGGQSRRRTLTLRDVASSHAVRPAP